MKKKKNVLNWTQYFKDCTLVNYLYEESYDTSNQIGPLKSLLATVGMAQLVNPQLTDHTG